MYFNNVKINVLSFPVVNRLDYPARIANGYAIVRYRTGYYAARADNAVAPDCHSGQHYHAAAQPRTVAYSHGFCIRDADFVVVKSGVGQCALGEAG